MARDTFERDDLPVVTAADVDPSSVPAIPEEFSDPEGLAERSGSRVRVVDTRTGREGTIDAADLPEALRSGFRLGTEAESARAARRRRFTGGDRQAQAFVEAGVDAFTFGGLSDIRRTQGEAAIEQQQGTREFNEGAATAGELLAGAAQGVGLGALGASVAAARGIGTAGRVGIAALEGVAEGTGVGLQRLSEDLLEGGGITAERLASTVGANALMGLGFGAAGGAIGELGASVMQRGLGGTTREGLEAVTRRQLGREPAPGLVDALMDRFARTSTAGLGEEAATTARGLFRLTPEGRAARAAIDGAGEAIDTLVPRMRSQLDAMARVADETQDFAVGALKRDNILRLVRSDATDLAAPDASRVFASARARADELAADTALVGGARQAKRIRDIADQFEEKVGEALARGGQDGAADAFIALDQAKRRLGRIAAQSARSRSGFQEYRKPLEGLYHEFRDLLERENLFGGAARAQREINAAWSELIPKSGKFDRLFRTDAGEQLGFRQIRTADPRKLRRFLEATGGTDAAVDDAIFEGMIENQQRLVEQISKHYDVGPELAESIARAGDNVGELRATLEQVRGQIRAGNQFRELSTKAAERESIFGGIGAAGLGAILGGAPGAVVGGVVGAALRPDKMIRMLAAIERRVGGFDRMLSRGVSETVESVVSGAASRTVRRGRARGALTGAAIAGRFDSIVEEIMGASEDPEGTLDRIAERTARIGEVAPGTAAELAAVSSAALAHLRSRIPPRAIAAPSLLPTGSTPSERVSRTEALALLDAAEAVENPLSVLDAAKDGRLSSEHVDAIRAVYPGVHAKIVEQVIEEISDLEARVPYAGRVTLSRLLGGPADPTTRPAYVARVQSTFTEEEAEGPTVSPSNARAPQFSEFTMTQTQRIAT